MKTVNGVTPGAGSSPCSLRHRLDAMKKQNIAIGTVLFLAFAAAPGVFVALLILGAIFVGIGFVATFWKSDLF